MSKPTLVHGSSHLRLTSFSPTQRFSQADLQPMISMKAPTLAVCAVLLGAVPVSQAQEARPIGSGPSIATFCNQMFPNELKAFVACIEQQAVSVAPKIHEKSAPAEPYRGLSEMGVLCPGPRHWPVMIELRPGGPAVGCGRSSGARIWDYRYDD